MTLTVVDDRGGSNLDGFQLKVSEGDGIGSIGVIAAALGTAILLLFGEK